MRLRDRRQFEFDSEPDRFRNCCRNRAPRHQHTALRLVNSTGNSIQVNLRVAKPKCSAIELFEFNLIPPKSIDSRLQLRVSAFREPQHARLLKQFLLSRGRKQFLPLNQ